MLEIQTYLLTLSESIEDLLDEYSEYSKQKDISIDLSLFSSFKRELLEIKDRIRSLKVFDFFSEMSIRYCLSRLASIYWSFSWRSSSYSEELHSNVFQISLLDESKVNYSRYEHSFLNGIESYISTLYNLPKTHGCIITNSWMSAFDITIQYLLWKWKLATIFIPSYIYFESHQQIKNIIHSTGSKIKEWKNMTEDDIIEYIISNNPDVVFLDPRTNTGIIRELDIEYIFSQLSHENISSKFVVDATMIGTDISFSYRYPSLDTIVYLSGSKYLWFWLDMNMMGVVLFNNKEKETLTLIRRNTGSILYEQASIMFPRFWIDTYLQRLKSLEKSATELYLNLIWDQKIVEKYIVSYPNDSHYDFRWAIVTINFREKRLRTKENYKKLIDILLSHASTSKYPLVHGVSFWFSTTRVSASDVMSHEEDVFLRVSCGIQEFYENKPLSLLFKQSLYEFKY